MNEPTDTAVEVEALPGWRAEVEHQLKALVGDILGDEPSDRKLTKLCEELEILACVVAWHGAKGNITSAAKSRGTSRRILRERIDIWKERHPHHVPPPLRKPPSPPSSAEEEARRAEKNARRRAARAKARAAKAARAALGQTEATDAKASKRAGRARRG